MNKTYDLLLDLNLIDSNSVEQYSDQVRDRKDIYANKCNKSGIIFLNTTDHIDQYYENKEDTPYWGEKDLEKAKFFNYRDDLRRCEQIRELVLKKKWCDFGTGAGGILEMLSGITALTVGVELQEEVRVFVEKNGFRCEKAITDFEEDFDIVTLFHVLEHLSDPINTLKEIRGKMTEKGRIIVEVPHANDILLSLFESESFKNFTLWSEHLILHTRESLERFLEAAGFRNIVISGYQRYPLSNHLFWLNHGKPGGHEKWSFLNNEVLVQAYNDTLSSINKTDTLIAIADC